MDQVKNMKLPRALVDELKRAEQRPSWESNNEGVHERVSFEDTIWGLTLAGGAYYNTPLRVTQVKEGSRAEHAGIKVGDFLTSINDIDSTTLTIQQAHDMIVESGLEIKFALSAPDVEETSHIVYQDIHEETILKEKYKPKKQLQKQHQLFKGAKMNDAWSLAWPCSKKRDILYRESNCFLVPSRYEKTHLLTLKGLIQRLKLLGDWKEKNKGNKKREWLLKVLILHRQRCGDSILMRGTEEGIGMDKGKKKTPIEEVRI